MLYTHKSEGGSSTRQDSFCALGAIREKFYSIRSGALSELWAISSNNTIYECADNKTARGFLRIC